MKTITHRKVRRMAGGRSGRRQGANAKGATSASAKAKIKKAELRREGYTII